MLSFHCPAAPSGWHAFIQGNDDLNPTRTKDDGIYLVDTMTVNGIDC